MATTVESGALKARFSDQASWRDGLTGVLQYCRRNPSLVVGLVLFMLLLLSSTIGSHFVDLQDARPISVRPLLRPSWALPFGSDKQGRNLLAVMGLTGLIGVLAAGAWSDRSGPILPTVFPATLPSRPPSNLRPNCSRYCDVRPTPTVARNSLMCP